MKLKDTIVDEQAGTVCWVYNGFGISCIPQEIGE